MALIFNLINPIRNTVREKFPESYSHFSLFRNNLKLQIISQKIITKYGKSILNGPFAGISYISRSTGSSLTPKLIGSYEQELHKIIERIATKNYFNIVDIGCAEGYYAVGLAVLFPNSIVYAFDTNLLAQELCKALAIANGVKERVIVQGNCSIESLCKLPLRKTLIFCDCEGYELKLLQPQFAPVLRSCDLIVELHDCINPSISSTILNRFADTHDIELIQSTSRNPATYPVLDFLSSEERSLAVSEFRPEGMQWAFMQAKTVHF